MPFDLRCCEEPQGSYRMKALKEIEQSSRTTGLQLPRGLLPFLDLEFSLQVDSARKYSLVSGLEPAGI